MPAAEEVRVAVGREEVSAEEGMGEVKGRLAEVALEAEPRSKEPVNKTKAHV